MSARFKYEIIILRGGFAEYLCRRRKHNMRERIALRYDESLEWTPFRDEYSHLIHEYGVDRVVRKVSRAEATAIILGMNNG